MRAGARSQTSPRRDTCSSTSMATATPCWHASTCIRVSRRRWWSCIRRRAAMFSAVWRVAGATSDDVEAIQRRLVAAFGGNVAATDVRRVCRLPGVLNWKHSPPAIVAAVFTDTAIWATSPVPASRDRWTTSLPGGVMRRRARPGAQALSQSELDWRAVRLALARGAIVQDQLVCELAKARQDKRRPADYARRTVARAQSQFGPTLPSDAPWLPLTRRRAPR